MRFNVKRDQDFQSMGCGKMHAAHFMGTCETCGRNVYSESCKGEPSCGDQRGDAPDPRGIFGERHSYAPLSAKEHGNMGRDLILCFACANDGDKYRAAINAATSTGTWTKRLQAEHDEKRKQYMAHQITHADFYLWLADAIGIMCCNLPVAIDRIQASKDEHLNDIPLSLWDRQDPTVRRLAVQAGMRSWSLCDTVCVLKNFALREASKVAA